MAGTPRDIVFTRHGAHRGAAWLKEAFALLWQARLPWLTMLLVYYLVMGVVNVVPFAGTLAVPLLKPVFAVGFLAAAWTQERGGRPQVRQLFQGFRSNLFALLGIGVAFVVGITLAVMATSAIDGGKLLDLLANPPPPDLDRAAAAERMQAVLLDRKVQLGMVFAALCALPVVLATWFAPGLVVFQDLGAWAALKASLRAAHANWRPLAVYAVLVFLFAGVVPGVVGSVLLVLASGLGEAAVAFVYLLLMPYLALFIATLHISDYVSYRDVFHAGETLAPLPVRDA
jgi:hypothetical protein